MQTQTEIRDLLAGAGLSPRKRFGQNFLIDQNLLSKLVELADVRGDLPVLEVGPGTGSLTEELLGRAAKVVAVEIDRGLCGLLTSRLGGRPNFRLVRGDVLAGKRHLAAGVLSELGPRAQLVSNLPYNIATPLVAQCLMDSFAASRRQEAGKGLTAFDRLTFTVQREVADRLTARESDESYGPVSVIVALLAAARQGPSVPPQAFWPRPGVESRMVRLDFPGEMTSLLRDAGLLNTVLTISFGQRRKQLGAIFRRCEGPLPAGALERAAEASGIDLALRAQQLAPARFLDLANRLAEAPGRPAAGQ